MIGNLVRYTAPTAAPITLAQAKEHLRVDHTADDDYITALIDAAVEHLDARAGILGGFCLVEQVWEWSIDGFPAAGAIELPLAPVQSIDLVSYRDANGDSQTLASSVYGLAFRHGLGRFYLKDGQDWPSTDNDPESVTVRMTVGHTATSSPIDYGENVPAGLLAAIRLHVGMLYQNRESIVTGTIAIELPLAYRALTAPHIIKRVG